jgi:predicted metallo-beta-lactamase superfamily hydrolase
MKITILGTESLGVRGLSCVVQTGNRTVVIDPGLALGYWRQRLLPHPAQVAVGEQVRRNIMAALGEATDVVLSHFHGDHIPLPDANPYQLDVYQAAPLLRPIRLWSKGAEGLSRTMTARREALIEILGHDLLAAEGQRDGPLAFSMPVPHGDPQRSQQTVMMTRIEDEDGVFVHASDIQLLNEETVTLLLDWRPDIVLAAGPPLYLAQLPSQQRKRAWENGLRLAHEVETLILDHHLLRCEAGLCWLERLAAAAEGRVCCAADFMERPRRLLEARRVQLYKEMPVPEGWHEAYANGLADTRSFQVYTDVHEPE